MKELVTIYKIICYEAPDAGQMGESCSLLPWRGGTGRSGADDGGMEYVLPENYSQRTQPDGEPAVFGEGVEPCELLLHNGRPLLVDGIKRRAYLLEPVKKLASLREATGISAADFAKLLNITQKELYEWENLEKKPPQEMLESIADVLHCEIADFQ